MADLKRGKRSDARKAPNPDLLAGFLLNGNGEGDLRVHGATNKRRRFMSIRAMHYFVFTSAIISANRNKKNPKNLLRRHQYPIK